MVFMMMICVTSFFHATTANLCSILRFSRIASVATFCEWLPEEDLLEPLEETFRMQDVDKDAGAPPIEKADEGTPIGAWPKEPAAPSSSLAPPTGSAPRRRRPCMKLTCSGFAEEEKQVVGSATSLPRSMS